MSEEMNQTHQPSGAPNNGSNPSPAPRRNNTWIYATIIALLLGTNVYLFLNKNKLSDQNQQLALQSARSDSSANSINTEYQAALARLDDLVSKNAQMDSMINDRNGEVAKLKGQIEKILGKEKKTEADYREAQKLIAQLNGKVRTYEERIAQLEGENKDLTDKNTVLTHERDSTVTENTGLQQKVKLGAVLHASNIRMVPIDLRRGGKKQRETEKARRVDLMRIYFDIDENRIAESGSKEVFLRIMGPDGKLLSNAAYGSGVTTGSNGESINYTLVKQVSLTQNEPVKDVTIDWQQDSEFAKGAYAIEIFNEGYKIGGGSVTLR